MQPPSANKTLERLKNAVPIHQFGSLKTRCLRSCSEFEHSIRWGRDYHNRVDLFIDFLPLYPVLETLRHKDQAFEVLFVVRYIVNTRNLVVVIPVHLAVRVRT